MKSRVLGAGACAMACLLAVLAVEGANADEHRPGFHRPGPAWHGDIHRFHEHDWAVWRGGHWVHGPHAGRRGWWWVVGPAWYFYPAPVYPYPNPWEPPAVELAAPAPNAPPPPTQVWYWCDASKQYYPYAATCPGGWRQVPATPAQ